MYARVKEFHPELVYFSSHLLEEEKIRSDISLEQFFKLESVCSAVSWDKENFDP